jgi:hypothetical protein
MSYQAPEGTVMTHQLIGNNLYIRHLKLFIFCLCFVIVDLEPEKWDLVLTDEYIEKLAPLIGRQSLQFLLELDMTLFVFYI